jgi:hypothetical protein
VWSALGAAAFYGAPAMPPVAMKILIALGFALAIAAYVRAWLGRVTQVSLSTSVLGNTPKLALPARLRGWTVILADVARSTALLSIVAIVGTTLARWLYPILDGAPPLAWLVVSAIAVGALLLTRRWMNAVQSLRALPIGVHRLTLILYGLSIAPGTIACLITMGAHQLSPRVGLGLPPYLLIVFLVAPVTLVSWRSQRHAAAAAATSVQEWAPLMQQAAWPVWVGAVCTFGAPYLAPGLFAPLLSLVAIGFAIAGYGALFASLRSSDGLERTGGPLGTVQ